jgi:hypothetical protein
MASNFRWLAVANGSYSSTFRRLGVGSMEIIGVTSVSQWPTKVIASRVFFVNYERPMEVS